MDVWHCDAEGAYSGVQGAESETFCRGVQLTDAKGVAEFRTVFPGWYTGRAVHIHVKVSPDGDQTHTGQLFFDPAATSAVYEEDPYAVRGEAETPNESDGIYAESGGRHRRRGDGRGGVGRRLGDARRPTRLARLSSRGPACRRARSSTARSTRS